MIDNNEQQHTPLDAGDDVTDFQMVDLTDLVADYEAETATDEPAETDEVEAVTEETEERESAGTPSTPTDADNAESYDWHTTYEAACSYGSKNLSVIPVLVDGTKKPGVSWKQYQTKRANRNQVKAWFHNGQPDDSAYINAKPSFTGIGIVCGSVSHNLTIIDFDDEAYWFRFADLLPNHPALQTIVDNCPLVQTPRPGRHLYVTCCEPVPGNDPRLAMDSTDKKALIETRGQGGYVVAPGGNPAVHPSGRPYQLISGSFDRIPRVSRQQLEDLFNLCRSLSELPIKPSEQPTETTETTTQQKRENAGKTSDYDRTGSQHPSTPSTTDGLRAGDDYNVRGDVLAILQRNGWTVTNTLGNGDIELRRPGKTDDGHSATFHAQGKGRKLSIWSSNASPFEAEQHYSPFDVYTKLEANGDWKEASRQLGKAGYGVKGKTKGSARAEKANTPPLEPLSTTFTDAMKQCLHSIYAFTPASFTDKDTVGYEVINNPDKLPLEKAAVQLYNANQLLTDCERLFLFALLKTKHIDSELINGIVQIGAPKEPVKFYNLDDLLRLDIPDPEYLPLLGEDGSTSKAFCKGMNHLIIGKPSGGKTHVLAQSAMHWDKQPVLFITEEATSIWKYRLQSYLNAGLPHNQNLHIVPAFGEGNSFVLSQIKQADRGSIIIIDTLRAFASVTKEDDSAEWCMLVDPWLIEARRNNLTSFEIHHSRKGKSTGDPSEDSSGSNGLPSRFEQRIGITAIADGSITIGGRAKNWAIHQSNWRRDGDKFTRMTPEEIRQLASTLQTAILEHMNPNTTITASQLFKQLTEAGVTVASSASVRTALSKLAGAGEAVNINADKKNSTGAWKLTTNLINSIESEDKR